MDKVKAKHILGVAVIALAVVVAYDYGMSKYNASKTAAPATTGTAAA